MCAETLEYVATTLIRNVKTVCTSILNLNGLCILGERGILEELCRGIYGVPRESMECQYVLRLYSSHIYQDFCVLKLTYY